MPMGLCLMNWAKGLTRSQGWSGFVRTDTRALAAEEDERKDSSQLKGGRREIKEKREGEKERKRLSK